VVVLSDDEAASVALGAWAASPRLAERARIVLRVPTVRQIASVARRLWGDLGDGGKWRSRFAVRDWQFEDEPRSGQAQSELVLTEPERAQLTRWARRGKTSPVPCAPARGPCAVRGWGTNKQVRRTRDRPRRR